MKPCGRRHRRGCFRKCPVVAQPANGAAWRDCYGADDSHARSGSALARLQQPHRHDRSNKQGDVFVSTRLDGATYNNPNVYDLGSPPTRGVTTRIPTAHKYRNKGNKKDLIPRM